MGGVIGVGNDIWIGERERITCGIWFCSCWSITLPILLWPDYYFVLYGRRSQISDGNYKN